MLRKNERKPRGTAAKGALIAGVLVVGFASPAAATQSAASGESLQSVTNTTSTETVVHKQITCRSGNFIGTADVTLSLTLSTFTAEVTRYKIEKLNEQAGGNKANLRLDTGYQVDEKNWMGVELQRSDDSMIQNGVWQSLDLRSEFSNRGSVIYGASVKFTFDKSGIDPSCTTDMVTIDPR